MTSSPGPSWTPAITAAAPPRRPWTSLSRDQLGPIAVEFADRQVTEISCYARGIHYLFPQVQTVIDIGGQDSKVVAVGPGGRPLDFAMNDECAAGTGRFKE